MVSVTVTLYGYPTKNDETEVKLPAKYEVCTRCDGSGVTTAHVESDGGGITGDEWAELDDDFKEDYLAGRYDRPCPECKGQRVVVVVEESCCDADQLKVYKSNLKDEAEMRAIERMEQRFGA